ncbi:hypothetical protein ACFC0D_24745 [Streptomyces sp. NPDC056222]|uniref:hypothetical protein n=1 Tax=Streptomyces sp. NPDC056222 TaxID=3345749 RepID=UPI0035DC837E
MNPANPDPVERAVRSVAATAPPRRNTPAPPAPSGAAHPAGARRPCPPPVRLRARGASEAGPAEPLTRIVRALRARADGGYDPVTAIETGEHVGDEARSDLAARLHRPRRPCCPTGRYGEAS